MSNEAINIRVEVIQNGFLVDGRIDRDYRGASTGQVYYKTEAEVMAALVQTFQTAQQLEVTAEAGEMPF